MMDLSPSLSAAVVEDGLCCVSGMKGLVVVARLGRYVYIFNSLSMFNWKQITLCLVRFISRLVCIYWRVSPIEPNGTYFQVNWCRVILSIYLNFCQVGRGRLISSQL